MLRSQRLTETLLTAGGLFVLVAGTALINDEVRTRLINVVSGDRAAELARVTVPTHKAALAVLSTLNVQAAPGAVLAFGLGAVVLFILMIRT